MNRPSANEIEEWICQWLSQELNIDSEDIDVEDAFVNLGVGSRQAVFLSCDLEDKFTLTLDPSLAWDYPTIQQLSIYLAAEIDNNNVALATH